MDVKGEVARWFVLPGGLERIRYVNIEHLSNSSGQTGSIADAAPNEAENVEQHKNQFYASARGMKDEGVLAGPLRQMLYCRT